MRLWVDAGISIATIVLTVVFEFVSTMMVQPGRASEFHDNPAAMLEFLGRPFDLWIVAFSLIVGAYLSSRTSASTSSGTGPGTATRAKLATPAIVMTITLLLIPFFIGLAAVFGGNWLKIYIPDVIAVGFVGYTVYALR